MSKDELFNFHYGFPRVSHGLLRVFHGFLEIDIFGHQNHDEKHSKSSLRLHTFPDFLALGNKYGGGEWQNDCNLIGKSKYMVCIGQIHQREKTPNMNLPHWFRQRDCRSRDVALPFKRNPETGVPPEVIKHRIEPSMAKMLKCGEKVLKLRFISRWISKIIRGNLRTLL